MLRKTNEKGKFYLMLYPSPHCLYFANGGEGHFSSTFLDVSIERKEDITSCLESVEISHPF